jgi:uncharacterized protein with HEPN domain
MQNDDTIRLRHMRDAARDALAFAKGRSREDLDDDRELVLAVVKCIEIIGEAASQVSSAGQAEVAELPWRDMIDMRHRLVHAYYDVNLDVVWSTLRQDLPPLVACLESVVPQQ